MFKKLSHLYYYLFIAKKSGLLPTPKDDRDFQTGLFKWALGYTPKHTRKLNPTVSVKDQDPFNTCQWNASIVAKEPDEKVRLSVRQMVCKGKKLGLISGDGFSNLRSGQQVLLEWGAVEEGIVTEDINNWTEYSKLNPDLYNERAAKHKIGSFWSVSSRNDLLKLLDDGRIVTTGLKWFTGFNQGGGFRSPWIINKAIGYEVGGHAIAIVGYDMDYLGNKVYICQNSYSDKWGDGGKFYITMDYLDKNNYGYFVNIDDIDKELGKFINEYDGRNVKRKGNPAIYHIQAGKKKLYPNWECFLSWNGKRRGFVEIDSDVLDKVETGDNMDITKSDYWEFLKDVKAANRLPALLELLNKE